MEKVGWKRQWVFLVGWFGIVVQMLLLTECSVKTPVRIPRNINSQELMSSPPVQLHVLDQHVIMDNGLVNVTLSTPQGMVTGIQYDGIDNLLEEQNKERNRGYWDVVWSSTRQPNDSYDLLEGTDFRVIMEEEYQIELSFTKTWNSSLNNTTIPLNVDKRFIMLRGSPGFYSYAIFERLEGWPDLSIYQGRIAFKLQEQLFNYMAVSDERQRIMPTAQDRKNGQVLDFPEAVLLTNPANPALQGEVDDKYQYSCDDKDNQVHGWIGSSNPPVGFWMITPSDEFRTGGPVKQDLTSHVGPTTLSMFFSTHYAGGSLGIKFENEEPWKKVFGPVLVYLNSASVDDDPLKLWEDAKEQMLIETQNWPYNFPLSEDYPFSYQRGEVTGRLLIRDRYIREEFMTANSAYVGLAPPGDVGSWQRENKGYQFWTRTDAEGYFLIKGVRSGNYSLYAWVPGIVGDYKYDKSVIVSPGCNIRLSVLVFDPPRNGPTLWEIGIPDRTAAEFYVPDPNPRLTNQLYVANNAEKFRQYGLWDRYAELYPEQDLSYVVGLSNYETDWFFAHVNRNIGNKTYEPTTWQITFDLQNVIDTGNYTLQLALASAHEANLQVRINDQEAEEPYFSTGFIGKDNAIARHGIHGLYWLFSVDISASLLLSGSNTIFLRQSKGAGPFKGVMYDYIRLEGPPETD
ncbi:hypothetical protein F0562_003114 [Nyssa sinensis]|uniref:rhamnogalacturonan endolyase n=1 Tax=Nyssa sinensis TaxID=561372 RepID=A0A5J5BUE3_9ASTE|nr:hypothetical protein F0562_003114 [Nyssa sinensis]